MRSITGKSLAVTILVGVLCMPSPPALAQATTTTTVTTISVAGNPPAPDVLAAMEACVGEPVTFISGTISIVAHETDNASGGIDTSTIFTAHNVSAVGQNTGTVYRGPGEDITKFNASGPAPLEFTNLFRISLIGPGQTPKFVLKDQFHITFNANGDITVTVNTSSTTCM
jgi:hypothetical protein